MPFLEPIDVYGTGYTVTSENPQVTISCPDAKTFYGAAEDAFAEYLHHVKNDPPYVTREAEELRDLCVIGHGYSDRAMTIRASLGISVSI